MLNLIVRNNDFFKVIWFFHLFFDDHDDLFKAGADRVKDGEIEDHMIVLVDRLDLLRSADTRRRRQRTAGLYALSGRRREHRQTADQGRL